MPDSIPLAYFITFRSYGTWLHGDERGAVDRFHNSYGTPFLQRDDDRRHMDERLQRRPPVILSDTQRESVERAVRESSEIRKWLLRAVNVRTNHAHVIVSTESDRPDRLLNALKANATRQLRNDRLWPHRDSPWSRGGRKRYVWTELGLERVIEYVVNGQDVSEAEIDAILNYREQNRRR